MFGAVAPALRPEAGRHAAHLSSRQPADRLGARGGDGLDATCRSWRSTTISSSTIRRRRSIRSRRSCRTWPRAGPGTQPRRKLTFKLRQGVKWHDGKPFTAKDVKCTIDKLTGKDKDSLPQEPARDLVPERQGRRGQWRLRGDVRARAGRSRRCSRCWRPAIRRSIHATSRRATCARSRSAPGRSSSPSSRPTSSSGSSRNPDYWKKGKPLRRRDRDADHPEPLDAHPGVPGRRVRHDLLSRTSRIPLLKDMKAQAPNGHLRYRAPVRAPQPDRQSRGRAVQQSGAAPGPGAGARPQGLHRHPDRGQGRSSAATCCRCPRASGACRPRSWPR